MMKLPSILAISAPVAIKAAEGEQSTPTFETTVYNGGPLSLNGWEHPVVVDLAALKYARSLVANLDHDAKKEVGHVTSKQIVGNQIILGGEISRVNDSSRELIESPRFPWQASIEADPLQVRELKAGEKDTINGSEVEGPAYVVAAELQGFAFLSRGADRDTTVSIAATADTPEDKHVDTKLEAWVRDIGLDPENLSDDDIATIKANYAGKPTPKRDEGFDALKASAERRKEIYAIAKRQCTNALPEEVEAIQEMADQAIKAGDSVTDFKLALMEAREGLPGGQIIHTPSRDTSLVGRTLEAAVCQALNYPHLERDFKDQELQAAHDRFKGRIKLNQLFMVIAEQNGYRGGYERDVTPDSLRAAFQPLRANQGFSTINTPVLLSNVANKFIRTAWEFVEQAWSMISTVRPVNDFKEITTVSLITDNEFMELGAGGTIPHGTVGEVTYANKADTYARMLAITRTDFINDDLGAFAAVPRKLGRGGALKLNKIFWTEFMDNATFFSAGNNNLLTGAGSVLARDGLNDAEVAFDQQTDPNGDPLGADAAILLVPSDLYNTGLELMGGQTLMGGDSPAVPNRNIFQGRYMVVKSRYLSNTQFTGNSATAWYLLADPNGLPTIEVAALNGNVMPTVESSDADFNTLGIQYRGYSDVGVRKQEYRGGVKSAGA